MPTTRFSSAVRAALALSALIFSSAVLAEGDIAEGKIKAYTCTGCHGIPGYNNVYPTYKVPKIGGQNKEYLKLALKAYKSGERKHATMQVQAQSLSDDDIDDIASYFASLSSESE